MTTENTSLMARENLAEAEAAITEFDRVQAGIADLKAKFSGVIFPVATTAGMKEAVAARAAVREPRIATEKARKAGKAPLLALGKILDEKAKWITAELVAIEGPIDEQIKSEEARKEAERQAKAEAERQRIAAHQAGIDAIRSIALQASGQPSGEVQRLIYSLRMTYTGPDFEEFEPDAERAKAETLDALQAMLESAQAREDEAARLEAERVERERLQAEEAARLAAEREELARLRAEQERQQAAALAEQQRIAAEAEAARRAADERAAQERAEADRVRAEAEAAERAKAEAEAARIQAEADERERQASAAAQKTRALRQRIDAALDAMGDDDLAAVIAYLRDIGAVELQEAA